MGHIKQIQEEIIDGLDKAFSGLDRLISLKGVDKEVLVSLGTALVSVKERVNNDLFIEPVSEYCMPVHPAKHEDDHDGDCVMTVEEFLEDVASGGFIDYDGFGYAVKDGMADPQVMIKPSRVEEIPKDATHIVWYNR